MSKVMVLLPNGVLISPPDEYLYRGNDGGNEYLPNDSGHYFTNGYAIWRPPNGSQILSSREADRIKQSPEERR